MFLLILFNDVAYETFFEILQRVDGDWKLIARNTHKAPESRNDVIESSKVLFPGIMYVDTYKNRAE